MTTKLSINSKRTLTLLGMALATWLAQPAWAQNYPITSGQRATANQVAQAGVPLSEIAANAPDSYLVKTGDTLWAISGLFLKSPWRWPELWGMNMSDIRNPHLIYPGQRLVLERKDGRAMLRMAGSGGDGVDAIPTETIRVSPRTRYEVLDSTALPAIKASLIEPFLAEPIVVDADGLSNAPRIVAAQEGRVLLTRGDRAYARGQNGNPMLDAPGKQQEFRVFRNATALKDPSTGEILGYEAQYVGKALLARSETTSEVTRANGDTGTEITPATIDIVSAKEEMLIGDRLLPEPPRELLSYAPRAPAAGVLGRVVSVYGSAVVNAAQNQVVAISLGKRDGIEPGHVMAILKDGARVVDKTDSTRPMLKLPDERNGLLMVFRTFDRVSYALVLDIRSAVNIGDRLISPL
ncbi:MAG: LysM peptidoglycan-binding domain-containing protein [Rhodoferax sp.]|nr:LysM peptidoglycan-binding domain-containing protein [Rhodoferax sp.]MCB2004770.1 LysM peptidoglycan-binding domain-containing protein [Rhodoferax sp.]MCB2029344.1 LysM peptidoglycan-binding domain-containing protein [Rhodoferax sp.]MCB2041849.1 LysM peptidoglycan-binding domain-containing protein [Rhodoferax sp.]MCP5263535.1 LysM peptidoglycan-binding domain-containing protein [Rhodoferax sp.]